MLAHLGGTAQARPCARIEKRTGEFRAELVGKPESLDAMNQQQRLADLENLIDEVRRRKGESVNIDEATKSACKEPTLLDALTWIAVWETERVVQQAKKYFETGVSTASHGGGWDTCFKVCFQRVMEAWEKKGQSAVHPAGARLYKVTYWLWHPVGSPEDRIATVIAYDPKDAEYQASIEPKSFIACNPTHQFSIRKIESAEVKT